MPLNRKLFFIITLSMLLNVTAYAHRPFYTYQAPPPNGQGRDFDAAAEQLGITVDSLNAALGPPPHNFAQAATTLGIGEQTLIAAIDMPARPNEPSGGSIVSQDTSLNSMSNENFTILTGENAFDAYGSALSTAGDINGDGFDDFIVGARGEPQDRSTPTHGFVYIYLGNAEGNISEPIARLEGEDTGTEFGRSLGYAGDVNGDGYDDILVGAHTYNGHQGRAYLYLGSADGVINEPTWITTGEKERDEYARSVYTAGDVNGDGFDDVLVGASGYADTMELQGKVYLYLGSADGLSTTPIFTFTGEGANQEFGRSATTAGDINNDGFDDVLVGVPGLTRGGETSTTIGMTYLFLGGAGGLDATPPTLISGESIEDRFGESADHAGDMNGDGFGDIVVGALGTSRAYIYMGSVTGLNTTPTILQGIEASDYGRSVAYAGDINGDGFDDVVVGASRFNQSGAFYVYVGSANGIVSDPYFIGTGDTGSGLGFHVAYAGDVNSDGYDDLMGGAPKGGDNQQGQTYIYLGRAS